MSDYKQAALNLYPEKWVKSDYDFSIDVNTGKRAVAEEVFKTVFEQLNSEQVAKGVTSAFLRRIKKCGIEDNQTNYANMSTALLFAIIAIRDKRGDE